MVEMIEILCSVLFITTLAVIVAMFLGCIICAIKNEVTCRNHLIISDAIYAYHMYLIRNRLYNSKNEGVTFDDMEDYDVTLKRFWDWGYTKILPPEKYELIKPFIRHRKGGKNER